MARWLTGVWLVVAAGLLAACGGDPPVQDFTASNRDGFLAACARPLDDPRMVAEVCECVFDRAEQEYDFSEFVALDRSLTAENPGELPPEIVDIIADCFIAENDLEN